MFLEVKSAFYYIGYQMGTIFFVMDFELQKE